MNLLRLFNPQNDIIWIANSEICSNQLSIYHVEKDENDSVSRSFLDSNESLRTYLESLDYKNREMNLNFYSQKQQNGSNKKKSLTDVFYKRIIKKYSHPLKYQ